MLIAVLTLPTLQSITWRLKKFIQRPGVSFLYKCNFDIYFIITAQLHIYIYKSILTALRYSSFQVVSVITTTAFVTVDFDQWPALSKSILIILMFVGGCAGSTAGAIKNIRILVLLKKAGRNFKEFYIRMPLPLSILAIKKYRRR